MTVLWAELDRKPKRRLVKRADRIAGTVLTVLVVLVGAVWLVVTL